AQQVAGRGDVLVRFALREEKLRVGHIEPALRLPKGCLDAPGERRADVSAWVLAGDLRELRVVHIEFPGGLGGPTRLLDEFAKVLQANRAGGCWHMGIDPYQIDKLPLPNSLS